MLIVIVAVLVVAGTLLGFYVGVRSQTVSSVRWHDHTDYEACLTAGCYSAGETIPRFIRDPRLRRRTMTDEERSERIVAVELWIKSLEDEIVYKGTKPVGVCGKVDDYIREAAIVYGNRQVFAEQMNAIHALQLHLEECIEADYYGVERPRAETDFIAASSAAWLAQW